ncbi:helix-turn-helix transcriptional regulator [Aerococcaceae bacterium zg-ZUI334]|uniref:helix-turn-helix domain-containing protein n=1 Tax=Aerococcaceae bacterium zg-252 TaxID=2796928 RepID=UPI001BA156C0|nr:helix-turn-helix transcriptional regulator [Aerococcaceae bacterium zg-ZUI334]
MNVYARKIRQYRVTQGLNQLDLAVDICSQGMISRIESGQVSPDIDTLIKIAKRLNTTVTDLIDENVDVNLSKMQMINYFTEKRDYFALSQYFNETGDEIMRDSLDPAYYYWIKAVISETVYKDVQESIDYLEKSLEALEQDTSSIDLKIKVFNSLANQYIQMAAYEKAQEVLIAAKPFFESTQVSVKNKQKILYTQALNTCHLKDYEEAVLQAKIAVSFAMSKDSIFLVDDLYLVITDAYLGLGKVEAAREYLSKADYIAKMKNNTALYPYLELYENRVITTEQNL